MATINIASGGTVFVGREPSLHGRINFQPSLNESGTLGFDATQGNALGLLLHALHAAVLTFEVPMDGGTIAGGRSGSDVSLIMNVVGGAQDGSDAAVLTEPSLDELHEIAKALLPLPI